MDHGQSTRDWRVQVIEARTLRLVEGLVGCQDLRLGASLSGWRVPLM